MSRRLTLCPFVRKIVRKLFKIVSLKLTREQNKRKNKMRSDYGLYGVAIICFIIAGVFATNMVPQYTLAEASGITVIMIFLVLGIISAAVGYSARPKEVMPTTPALAPKAPAFEPPPSPPPTQPAVEEAAPEPMPPPPPPTPPVEAAAVTPPTEAEKPKPVRRRRKKAQ